MNSSGAITSSDRRPPLWEIEWRLINVIEQQTGLSADLIKLDSRLVEDLNIDSLEIVELILAVEDEFDVTIPDDAGRWFFLGQPATVRRLAELVEHQWSTGAPERRYWFGVKPEDRANQTTPFTQLGSRAGAGEWLEGPLYEPLDRTREGFVQWRRRTDGMRCVVLPGADVEIGSDDPNALPDQRPVHRVRLTTFLIDAEPVSVSAYTRFLNSVGELPATVLRDWCQLEEADRRGRHVQWKHGWSEWAPVGGTARQPVVLVSWFGANAYSLWANRRDWRRYRADGCIPDALRAHEARGLNLQRRPDSFLPTEAQWEYAARGAAIRRFPWGDTLPSPEPVQVGLHTARADYGKTLPLAEVSARMAMSPFGLHHMAGNVWQWCADWYVPDFYHCAEARSSDPINTRSTGIRSERGGSWIGPIDLCRSSYRRGRPPLARGRCLGFRCVGWTEDLPG